MDLYWISNAKFSALFADHGYDINETNNYFGSKAKRLRKFWNDESDSVVYPILKDLLNYATSICEDEVVGGNSDDMDRARKIVEDLQNKNPIREGCLYANKK